MYAITVVINSAMFQLLYKTEEKAREADKIFTFDPTTALGSNPEIKVADDFGQEFSCKRSQLAGYIFENMEKTKLAHVERALHQQKTQLLAQKQCDLDPTLRMRGLNGPPMMSPFPPRN